MLISHTHHRTSHSRNILMSYVCTNYCSYISTLKYTPNGSSLCNFYSPEIWDPSTILHVNAFDCRQSAAPADAFNLLHSNMIQSSFWALKNSKQTLISPKNVFTERDLCSDVGLYSLFRPAPNIRFGLIETEEREIHCEREGRRHAGRWRENIHRPPWIGGLWMRDIRA